MLRTSKIAATDCRSEFVDEFWGMHAYKTQETIGTMKVRLAARAKDKRTPI
jgi:hypothetical protein